MTNTLKFMENEGYSITEMERIVRKALCVEDYITDERERVAHLEGLLADVPMSSGMGSGGKPSRVSDPVGRNAARREAAWIELEKCREHMELLINQAIIIDRLFLEYLTDVEAKLVRLRLGKQLSWNAVTYEVGYSRSQCVRKYMYAMKKLCSAYRKEGGKYI